LYNFYWRVRRGVSIAGLLLLLFTFLSQILHFATLTIFISFLLVTVTCRCLCLFIWYYRMSFKQLQYILQRMSMFWMCNICGIGGCAWYAVNGLLSTCQNEWVNKDGVPYKLPNCHYWLHFAVDLPQLVLLLCRFFIGNVGL